MHCRYIHISSTPIHETSFTRSIKFWSYWFFCTPSILCSIFVALCCYYLLQLRFQKYLLWLNIHYLFLTVFFSFVCLRSVGNLNMKINSVLHTIRYHYFISVFIHLVFFVFAIRDSWYISLVLFILCFLKSCIETPTHDII